MQTQPAITTVDHEDPVIVIPKTYIWYPIEYFIYKNISFIETTKGDFIFTWPIISSYLLLSLSGNLEVSKLEVHMNHEQKTPVTPQKQLHCQLDRHQIIKYTVNSVSKWNVLDQELKFFCLLPFKNEDVLLLMKVRRFLILCYSLLKRRKMLIFAILTFRKPASFYMQLMSCKVVLAQATHLPPCQKPISTSWLPRLEMVDRIQNLWHFDTKYVLSKCNVSILNSSKFVPKKVFKNCEVLDSALYEITLYPLLFKLNSCKLQHATKLLMQQTTKKILCKHINYENYH